MTAIRLLLLLLLPLLPVVVLVLVLVLGAEEAKVGRGLLSDADDGENEEESLTGRRGGV